ncbi:MAG: hypothetical protein ACK2US_00380 [Anaerolineae bacterium]|jgi:hypothetical protein
MDQKNHASDQPTIGRTAGAESVPLLLTKLYRPPVRPDLEQRPRLEKRLERNRHWPLTLITARQWDRLAGKIAGDTLSRHIAEYVASMISDE